MEIKKYHPLVDPDTAIKAVRLTEDNMQDVADWAGAQVRSALVVNTDIGDRTALPGDYVFRNDDGVAMLVPAGQLDYQYNEATEESLRKMEDRLGNRNSPEPGDLVTQQPIEAHVDDSDGIDG